MVDNDQYCIAILTQVSAVTKALQAVSLGLLEERDTLLPYLPNYAGSAVTTVRPQDDLLSPVGGGFVLLAWAVVPLLAAAVVLRRRDA